jgi:hypothetical protein
MCVAFRLPENLPIFFQTSFEVVFAVMLTNAALGENALVNSVFYNLDFLTMLDVKSKN